MKGIKLSLFNLCMILIIIVVLVTSYIYYRHPNGLYSYKNPQYIQYEPIRYLSDVYSVGYNFSFCKECVIIPYYCYKNTPNKFYTMNRIHAKIGLNKVEFGPFDTNNNDSILLYIKTNDGKIIFSKIYNKPKMNDYMVFPIDECSLEFSFLLTSCIDLIPNSSYSTDLLPIFSKECVNEQTKMVLNSGDVVYLQDTNITSPYGIQDVYNTLFSQPKLRGSFENITWVCGNDDHELSINDGTSANNNLTLCKSKLQENFPLNIQLTNSRTAFFSVKKYNFIVLDTVSNYKYDNNRVISVLGENQLDWLKNALVSIVFLRGNNALTFIMMGKTFFGKANKNNLMNCIHERDDIINTIKSLQLKNIVFLVGDSHYSDITEYTIPDTDIILKEIRSSSMTSARPTYNYDENPLHTPGSEIGGLNSFAKITIKEMGKGDEEYRTNIELVLEFITVNNDNQKHIAYSKTWPLTNV